MQLQESVLPSLKGVLLQIQQACDCGSRAAATSSSCSVQRHKHPSLHHADTCAVQQLKRILH